MTANLIKAINAAEAYANGEGEKISFVSARSLDVAGRWFRVEGVRKMFRRVYVVDCAEPNAFVVEVMGGAITSDESALLLITYATTQRHAMGD